MKKIKKSSDNPLGTTKVMVTLEFDNLTIDDIQKLLDRRKGKVSVEAFFKDAVTKQVSSELSHLRLMGLIE